MFSIKSAIDFVAFLILDIGNPVIDSISTGTVRRKALDLAAHIHAWHARELPMLYSKLALSALLVLPL
jgi:hypothetical protein